MTSGGRRAAVGGQGGALFGGREAAGVGGQGGALFGGREAAGVGGQGAVAVGDRGAATVEAALAVCGLVAVLVLGVEAVMAVVAQIRCTDAAREAARLVARGEDGRAGAVVRAIAPDGAVLVVRKEGDTASVEVSAAGRLVDVRASAFAVVEPGIGASGR
ncbi:hypothetical protein GCM10010492_42550 [Saccharothrix mutabilis subsp. mutabilis]|uniref:TadE-like domain-containing protein n=1 Tax=Saccharothrix mutabilis subsp. mutabilis TaxID=66855 RepID=A0ABN0U590_9PSEU